MKQLSSAIGKQDRLVFVYKVKRHEVNSGHILALCLGALYKFWYRELGPGEQRKQSLCPGLLGLLGFVELDAGEEGSPLVFGQMINCV